MKMNFKLTLIVLLIYFLAVIQISAAPPDIPILIYGKVQYDNKLPATGIGVRAIWIDINSDINTRVTRTIDIKEANTLNKPELLGVYRFEIYNFQEDTEIRIETGKKSVTLIPEQGILIRAPDIIIDLPKSNITSNNSNFSLIDSLEPLTEIFDYIAKIMGLSNRDKAIQNYQDLTMEIGDYDDNKSLNTSGTGTRTFDNAEKKEGLEENFSKTEPDSFSSGDAYDNTPSKDPVRDSVNYNKYDSKLNFSKQNKQIPEKESKEALYNLIFENNEKISALIMIIVIGLILGIIIMIIFIIKKYFKPLAKKLGILSVSINNLNKIESRRFLTKTKENLSPDNNILEAVDLFSTKNINIIPILSLNKDILGTISKYDIITNINNPKYDEMQKIKISKIMNKKYITCSKNKELGDIYSIMLQNNINEIIIKENEKFIGTIDYFNILKLLSESNFVIENPPKIREAMGTLVTRINHNEKIFKLRNMFISENTDYAVVMKDKLPAGIVTLKDLMIAIKKNFDFKLNTVEQIMSVNIISMTPGTEVYEAFKIMLERRFNQIPVIEFNVVVGIVNIKFLVKMYYDFLNEIRKRIKENPKNAVEIDKDM